MDGGVAFVANPKAPEVVQVRKAALDHPALCSQPRAMRGAASGDNGCDATGPQQSAVLVVVVASVGEQAVGLLAGPAALAFDRPGVELFEQRDQLGDVVAVAGSERHSKRDAGRIDQQVVFGARAGAIDRGWPG